MTTLTEWFWPWRLFSGWSLDHWCVQDLKVLLQTFFVQWTCYVYKVDTQKTQTPFQRVLGNNENRDNLWIKRETYNTNVSRVYQNCAFSWRHRKDKILIPEQYVDKFLGHITNAHLEWVCQNDHTHIRPLTCVFSCPTLLFLRIISEKRFLDKKVNTVTKMQRLEPSRCQGNF